MERHHSTSKGLNIKIGICPHCKAKLNWRKNKCSLSRCGWTDVKISK